MGIDCDQEFAEDLAIDRHGDAAIDERLEPRIGLAKPGEQLADGGGFDLDRVAALRRRTQRAPERYADPPGPAANHERPSIALSTRGGDIGMLRQAHADRIRHRVGDRGQRRHDRGLADAAHAIGMARDSGISRITVSIIGRSEQTGMR